MAEVNYTQMSQGYDPVTPSRRHDEVSPAGTRRLMSLAGAVVSVAMLGGAGYWGYKIAVRNLTGIPVIRALEGPMRVAPENPGGSVTAHQGLSVNDVAAIGAATPLPEEIVLAPRPVELAEEDIAGLAPEAPAAQVPPVAGMTAGPPQMDLSETDLPPDPLTSFMPLGTQDEAATAGTTGDVQALADAIAAGIAPLSDSAAQAHETTDATAVVPEEVTAAVVPGGVGASLRPVSRPASIGGVAAAQTTNAAVAAALSAAVREIDGATIAAGTRMVQFGAFDSADEARAYWDSLAGRFGELMGSKARVVQSAESGGRTFYRLRAEGFTDEADARRFCSAITAEGSDCIPVTQR